MLKYYTILWSQIYKILGQNTLTVALILTRLLKLLVSIICHSQFLTVQMLSVNKMLYLVHGETCFVMPRSHCATRMQYERNNFDIHVHAYSFGKYSYSFRVVRIDLYIVHNIFGVCRVGTNVFCCLKHSYLFVYTGSNSNLGAIER